MTYQINYSVKFCTMPGDFIMAPHFSSNQVNIYKILVDIVYNYSFFLIFISLQPDVVDL